MQDGGCIPADFVESNTNNQTTEIYVADGNTDICPSGTNKYKCSVCLVQLKQCSVKSASSPSSAPAANATIEDCPTVDLGWPHVWKVYGSKCYFLVGYPSQKYTPAKEHCEDVISLKYHTH